MGVDSSRLAFSNNYYPSIKHFHISAAIYCEKSYDDSFLRKCDYYIDSQDKDIQCLINKEGTNLFVCFRGTDHIKDWRSNLNLNLVDIENSSHQFHEGFYKSWNSVKHSIKNDIEESFDNHMDIQTVIFTGHSAGVVANLAAYDLHDLIKKEYNKGIEAVTFGAPKCCNENFKTDFKKKINCTRFVLKDDIITQFPVGNSYKHLGNPIYMRGQMYEDKSPRSIFNFLGTVVNEHNIENYVDEIKNLIE